MTTRQERAKIVRKARRQQDAHARIMLEETFFLKNSDTALVLASSTFFKNGAQLHSLWSSTTDEDHTSAMQRDDDASDDHTPCLMPCAL
jgi:hypothetical protein